MSSLVHPDDLLLPTGILEPTPSRRDGIDERTERKYRRFGCELAHQAGVLLRLSPVVLATAQTLIHRFLYRRSLHKFDIDEVSAASVFVAAKVEEEPRPVRDVLNVFHHIEQQRQGLSARSLIVGGPLYSFRKSQLMLTERNLLKDLGFCMYTIMEHPHKFILYFVKVLEGSQELARRAWAFLNDSLRLDLCVRYHAEVIACAAIFLAARQVQEPLPEEPPWYAAFGVDRLPLLEVATSVLDLTEEPSIPTLPSLKPADEASKVDDAWRDEEECIREEMADRQEWRDAEEQARAEEVEAQANEATMEGTEKESQEKQAPPGRGGDDQPPRRKRSRWG